MRRPDTALVTAGLLTLMGAAWACDGDPLLPEPSDFVVVDFGDDSTPWPRDPWQLQDVRLDDAQIDLTVGFDGGCRPHQFWLVAVDDWEILPDAGPTRRVGAPILLAHEAHGDPCERWVTRTLRYDLEPLRTAYRQAFDFGPASILLRIPGGQGSPDTVTVDLFVPAVYPPD